jgi:hypothetical protein
MEDEVVLVIEEGDVVDIGIVVEFEDVTKDDAELAEDVVKIGKTVENNIVDAASSFTVNMELVAFR